MLIFGQPLRRIWQVNETVLIVLVTECRRIVLSFFGVYRVTACKPSRSSSWISSAPELLSSIKIVVDLNRLACSRTVRFSSGYSVRRRRHATDRDCSPFFQSYRHYNRSVLWPLQPYPSSEKPCRIWKALANFVGLEPCKLDHAAPERSRFLLILT